MVILVLMAVVSSVRPACAELTDELVGYWPLDGDGEDVSLGGRDLTVYGGAGFAAGLFGQTLDLHRNPNQYAARPGDDDVFDFGSSDFTVQIWVNYNTNIREQNLFEKFYGSGGPGWTLTSFVNNGPNATGDVHFWAIEGQVALYSEAILDTDPGHWRHMVVRRSEEEFELFYDGTVVAAQTNRAPVTDTSNPLLLGRRNLVGNGPFPLDGRLDEAALWRRALSNSEIEFLYNGGLGRPIDVTPVVGDFNDNGLLDVDDLDRLAKAMVVGKPVEPYDLNGDSAVTYADRQMWIHDLKSTYFGDANLDGEFNSNDFVEVFGAGKYESGKYARWSEGDWDGNLLFNTDDFVVGFQDGGYEQGPLAAVAGVPEPSGWLLALMAAGVLGRVARPARSLSQNTKGDRRSAE